MIGPKPPKGGGDETFDECVGYFFMESFTTRKRAYAPTEDTANKQQRGQSPPPIAVKEEVSDAVHYDLLSGDTPLRYFYLGLVAGSQGDMTFHALALPFLYRLLKRYHTDSISLKCTLINTRVRWVLDDDHMNEIEWTTYDTLFHKGTKSKRLFLAFFFGWIASENASLDTNNVWFQSTDIDPLKTLQSLLNSFGFSSTLRLVTMPATAMDNPSAQYQLAVPLDQNKALLQQGLDVLNDERIPLNTHTIRLKAYLGHQPMDLSKIVSDKSDLHRQVARDFYDQPLASVNAMLEMADMSLLTLTRDLDITAFISTIKATRPPELLSYLLCYDPTTDVKGYKKSVCTMCDKVYCGKFAQHTLQKHVRKIHSNKKIHCAFDGCDRMFDYREAMKQHIKTFHEKQKVTCPVEGCGKVYAHDTSLTKHIRATHQNIKFSCTFEGCDKRFTVQKSLWNHIQCCHSEEKIPCDVEDCNVMFASKSSMREHLRSVHGNEKVACTFDGCDMVFAHRSSMRKHVKVFHEKRRVVCIFIGCKKNFCSKPQMAEHVKIAHENQKIACTYDGCDMMFAYRSSVRKHMKVVHENQRHPCTFDGCKEVFRSLSGVKYHIKASHEEQRQQVQCTFDDCDEVFRNTYRMNTHVKTFHYNQKLVCIDEDCDLTFGSESRMLQHYQVVHEDEMLECPYNGCNKTHTQKRPMYQHIKRDHENQKVPCAFDGCDKTFTQRYNMAAHFKRFHVN